MAAANPLLTKLLDFSTPVDVDAVESTVGLFYGAPAQDQVRGRGRGMRVHYNNAQGVICCCCLYMATKLSASSKPAALSY